MNNYFCSAKKRPKKCSKKKNNLCCIWCDDIEACLKRNGLIKPCTINNCSEDEKCEFHI